MGSSFQNKTTRTPTQNDIPLIVLVITRPLSIASPLIIRAGSTTSKVDIWCRSHPTYDSCSIFRSPVFRGHASAHARLAITPYAVFTCATWLTPTVCERRNECRCQDRNPKQHTPWRRTFLVVHDIGRTLLSEFWEGSSYITTAVYLIYTQYKMHTTYMTSSMKCNATWYGPPRRWSPSRQQFINNLINLPWPYHIAPAK